MNKDLQDLLDKINEAFSAFRRAEDHLDYALETNRSITKALRESRKARNELIKLLIESNNLAKKMLNE